METNRINAAIETSKLWLKAANDTRIGGSYNVSMYSLEMSLEIVLKAMLMVLDIDPPKTHDVGNVVKKAFKELDKKVIEEKQLSDVVNLFYILLGFRNESGYMYDSNTSNEVLKKAVDKYYDPTEKSIKICEAVIKSLIR